MHSNNSQLLHEGPHTVTTEDYGTIGTLKLVARTTYAAELSDGFGNFRLSIGRLLVADGSITGS